MECPASIGAVAFGPLPAACGSGRSDGFGPPGEAARALRHARASRSID